MTPEIQTMDEITQNVSDLQDNIITGFDVEDYYMSDRQCVKKLISDRNPEISDSDLNLVVYGTDIAAELGPSYVPYSSELQYVEKIPDEKSTQSNESDKKKKKREKRQKEKVIVKDEDSPFKPIKKNDRHFDEVEQIKSSLRKNAFLFQEKSKDLGFELGTTTTLIASAIPGMIAMVAPPTFNVPGAISILMLALNNLKGLQSKVKEIVPLVDTFSKANMVVMPDKLPYVANFINNSTSTLSGLSKSINALQLVSQAKIDSLDKAQSQMEETKKQLLSLKPEQFENDAQYQAKKKELELKKETISKDAEKALKA